MTFYDIFNGDADGICALHQLRLAQPREAVLVTGVKRDIALLGKMSAEPGDEFTVLDISLRENRAALQGLLQAGAHCLYFDHHSAGEIPGHPNLDAHIETAPDICTSLLVDRYLNGRHRVWAVVAAFGDNLHDAALAAAEVLRLNPNQLQALRELGECINYNAYGETTEDLHYHPADLYELIRRYRDPFAFMVDEPVFDVLKACYADDMERAADVAPELATERHAAFLLPDEAWARRINGVLGNRLARQWPERAHAVLVRRQRGGYVVSVRAPLANPVGAERLCRQFTTGGGREGAAGINVLSEDCLGEFLAKFREAF